MDKPKKYIEQLGLLVYSDKNGDLCIPSSDLRHEGGDLSFMMHNPKSGNKYRVQIKITEI